MFSTVNRSSRRKKGRKIGKVGYDAGKQVNGREIRALVDGEGLPMRVVVHSASIQDRDGLGWSSTRYAGPSRGSN
jgi:hypothetical protein